MGWDLKLPTAGTVDLVDLLAAVAVARNLPVNVEDRVHHVVSFEYGLPFLIPQEELVHGLAVTACAAASAARCVGRVSLLKRRRDLPTKLQVATLRQVAVLVVEAVTRALDVLCVISLGRLESSEHEL